MLIMHDDISASSSAGAALPALMKRDDARSLVWQQETTSYPSEPTLPPPPPPPAISEPNSPPAKKKNNNKQEFAQHQKLHHNIIVGAQQEHTYARQHHGLQEHDQHAAVAAVEGSTEKDNDYFSTADTTREYSTESLPYGGHHVSTAPTGSFLYASSYDKPKSSVLAPPNRNKLMGPPFFGSDLGGSLPTMLPKDQSKKALDLDHLYGSDQRRIKPSNAFPSVQYSSTGGSFSISSDSAFNRPSFTTNSSHFAPLRPEEERSYENQPQNQQHQMLPPPGNHVLRPPPQSNEDNKYGGFAVPPPINPAAPEFTGEELNVVLQLMNENY
ncbi:hypothetical protein JG688_00011428 [Phytophthora aleatoria]|uniref:Uncharacterized protein n=1 Tax=Phytophthora aleatoria TaxID=2496075 RepID=A0A8J5J428_9STRA|nr:hypothetical protein JG688_00011428 [Phytophthora aleatoria]